MLASVNLITVGNRPWLTMSHMIPPINPTIIVPCQPITNEKMRNKNTNTAPKMPVISMGLGVCFGLNSMITIIICLPQNSALLYSNSIRHLPYFRAMPQAWCRYFAPLWVFSFINRGKAFYKPLQERGGRFHRKPLFICVRIHFLT